MLTDVLKALIQNSTTLVAVFLFVNRFSRWKLLRPGLRSSFLQGTAYALCGLAVIFFSVEVMPGVLIDMRTPVIVTAALTGGPLTGAVAALPVLVTRIIIGGAGVPAGAGIILSALIFGLFLRSMEKRLGRHGGTFFQIVTGVGSAVIYYLWILILPGGIAMTVLRETFFPLTIASVISIMAIFLIRKREEKHYRTLRSLGETRNLFEEIALDSSIGIVVLHEEMIAYVNQPLLDRYAHSVSAADVVGQELSSLLPGELVERFRKFMGGLKVRGYRQAVPLQVPILGKGTPTFLVHARELTYKGLPSLIIVSADITELVNAERLLQDRVDQLQLSLDSSGAVLWKADLDLDLLLAEPELFDLLHYHPAEDPPSFSSILNTVSMTEELSGGFRSMMEGNSNGVFGEISLTDETGECRWFNTGARVTHVDGSGRPVELTGILFDTTSLKRRELEIKALELNELQVKKMESIGRLAGGVAHDFNNLLHVITGYAELLRKDAGDPRTVEELTGPIIEASMKGSDLVRQLLLFSRSRMPELVPVNVAQVTEGFLGLIRRVLEESIIITSDMPSSLPAVSGDRGQIEQILMNLCINSRDAMPDGGRIHITGQVLELALPRLTVTGTLPAGDWLSISVSDTGPGIPPDRAQSVFEPFYTTRETGSGLGLATVLGIMKAHSGLVDISNSREGGAEITLFFPLDLKLTAVSPAEPDIHRPYSGSMTVTVLLAEDDPLVMDLTAEGLRSCGLKVFTASDGREAVDLFREQMERIDILVFDVVMPEMNGPDAYRKILELRTRDIPVIFTTGYAGERLTGLDGDYHILAKPFAVRNLLEMIEELTN